MCQKHFLDIHKTQKETTHSEKKTEPFQNSSINNCTPESLRMSKKSETTKCSSRGLFQLLDDIYEADIFFGMFRAAIH